MRRQRSPPNLGRRRRRQQQQQWRRRRRQQVDVRIKESKSPAARSAMLPVDGNGRPLGSRAGRKEGSWTDAYESERPTRKPKLAQTNFDGQFGSRASWQRGLGIAKHTLERADWRAKAPAQTKGDQPPLVWGRIKKLIYIINYCASTSSAAEPPPTATPSGRGEKRRRRRRIQLRRRQGEGGEVGAWTLAGGNGATFTSAALFCWRWLTSGERAGPASAREPVLGWRA